MIETMTSKDIADAKRGLLEPLALQGKVRGKPARYTLSFTEEEYAAEHRLAPTVKYKELIDILLEDDYMRINENQEYFITSKGLKYLNSLEIQ